VILQRKDTEAVDFKDGDMQTGDFGFSLCRHSPVERVSSACLYVHPDTYTRNLLSDDNALEVVI
jgi:hypothetical protein